LGVLEEVQFPAVSPERFRAVLDDYAELEEAIATAVRVLEGRVIWHVNSTARGGGVAEMLQVLLPYARGVGVDTRWLTIDGSAAFFELTKRIHNNLHGAPGDGGPLGEREHELYERELAAAGAELAALASPGDIVYLHDPQPAGLARYLRAHPVDVVWRCHIGVDRPNELVEGAEAFLLPYIEEAQVFVFTRDDYVWPALEGKRIWVIPPSIDVFSPKNQEMDAETVRGILEVVGLLGPDGATPMFRRQDGSVRRIVRSAEVDQVAHLPEDAPLVVQVSRWDRLKDHAGLLTCFAEDVQHEDAHLALVGPSVAEIADDPEGAEVLEELRAQISGLPDPVRARTHLVCLPMDDIEENAAMVNAVQRYATIVVQKSLVEGFGLTVAEAMWKARPMVASAVGGIKDQVTEETGILVDDPHDLPAFGAAIDSLLDDPERARAMGEAGRRRIREHFLGSRHLVQYVRLIEQLSAAR
jgi:trehalose synthase